MLHSELKNKNTAPLGQVQMRVDGNPFEIMTELYALIVAVSNTVPMEGMREQFIDDLPTTVRLYRSSLNREIVMDNNTINKAKGGDN